MVQTRLHKHSLLKKEQAVSGVASRASVRDPINEFQEVYGSRAGSAAFRQQIGSDFSRSGQIQPAIQAKPSFRGLSHALAPIQAKLTVGPANDRYEQEADRVARQVVQRINAPVSNSSTQGESVQRQEEEDELQMKPIAPIQRLRMSVEGGEVSTGLESEINRARGGGQPLDIGLQAKMGEAMGADFSGVKVHTDSQSDQLNQSIEAKAFTTGQDLFFRKGAYEPGSKEGQELIAHELTHVVQQESEIQRQQQPTANCATPPIANSPELVATLQNIENAYSSTYGIHNQQLIAMTTFYTDIEKSDPPTPTEQALTVAASATIGSATAFIGLRIANNIARSLTTSAEVTAARLSIFVANQITDNCKDQGKLGAQRSLQSSRGSRDAKFRFKRALVDGITQSAMTATETFNNNRDSYQTNPNGLIEARALLNSLHTQMQNAYDLQYAQVVSQWSTLQTNWAGLAGDRGTLVLQIRCMTPGADIQIIGSKLEGLNQATRAPLAGLNTVSIGELGLPVRVEGENPHWIWGTTHSSDNISITGRPGQIPNFQHSGNTAYFLISRGIAKYGFQSESVQSIPYPLQETSAVLMFNEIFNFPLSRLGNLEG